MYSEHFFLGGDGKACIVGGYDSVESHSKAEEYGDDGAIWVTNEGIQILDLWLNGSAASTTVTSACG